jgi:hypothetical protein
VPELPAAASMHEAHVNFLCNVLNNAGAQLLNNMLALLHCG